MAEAAVLSMDKIGQTAPEVGRLASKLLRSKNARTLSMDSRDWQIIAKVLSYAAAAEQQIAEQRQRIAYLESLSITDDVTEIANRRGFLRFMTRTLAAAARHDEAGVIGLLDLDDFKSVNDVHGHLAGDALLHHVASALSDNVRPFDFVARLGGDEFAVVLVRCAPDQGGARLRELQKLVNATTVPYRGDRLRVSVSLGVETFGPDSRIADVMEMADRHMYAEKRGRKGRAAAV